MPLLSDKQTGVMTLYMDCRKLDRLLRYTALMLSLVYVNEFVYYFHGVLTIRNSRRRRRRNNTTFSRSV